MLFPFRTTPTRDLATIILEDRDLGRRMAAASELQSRGYTDAPSIAARDILGR